MTTISSATTHPCSTSTPNKTYLQQCTDDLNPGCLSSFERKATLHQVAAIATLVAFTVFSLGSIAATALFAPIYVPLTALSVCYLFKYVQKGSDKLQLWSDQAGARAEQLKQISSHYQGLSTATLQQTLQEKGITWSTIPGMQNPANLETLKPLIARHIFWEKHVAKLEERKQEKLAKATKLTEKNHVENKGRIYDLQCEALEIEKRALEGRIKTAFINAVIRRPGFLGTLDNLGTLSPITGQERVIGNAVSSGSTMNQLFTFKDGRTAAITIDEVKRLTITDLAQRILSAMPA